MGFDHVATSVEKVQEKWTTVHSSWGEWSMKYSPLRIARGSPPILGKRRSKIKKITTSCHSQREELDGCDPSLLLAIAKQAMTPSPVFLIDAL